MRIPIMGNGRCAALEFTAAHRVRAISLGRKWPIGRTVQHVRFELKHIASVVFIRALNG